MTAINYLNPGNLCKYDGKHRCMVNQVAELSPLDCYFSRYADCTCLKPDGICECEDANILAESLTFDKHFPEHLFYDGIGPEDAAALKKVKESYNDAVKNNIDSLNELREELDKECDSVSFVDIKKQHLAYHTKNIIRRDRAFREAVKRRTKIC